jgi:hypothetical protein
MIAKTVLTRWRANPINFIQQVLINPETNRPFVLLDAERAFLTYAFTLGADGRLLYPEQVYACPKKSGKTTFAAIYVITVVLLYGGAYPEAICAANDYDQSVGRVFAAIKRIIECSPQLAFESAGVEFTNGNQPGVRLTTVAATHLRAVDRATEAVTNKKAKRARQRR